MKSPFPGMDPYLERHWLDVHSSLVVFAKAAIQSQLSDDLVARNEERLIVEDRAGSTRSQYSDVRVVEHGKSGIAVRPLAGVAVAEPLIVEVENDPIHQRNVEIIDVASGGKVVTVIEFVSPTNKLAGAGRTKYQEKQQECVEAAVNLVEVDLTRQGTRELLLRQGHLPPEYRTAYFASVYRATWAPFGRKEAYRIPLRERLPAIRVPLRAHDADVVLDVQALVDQAYEAGRYDRTTDYTGPCEPPMEEADGAWARELLRVAGRR